MKQILALCLSVSMLGTGTVIAQEAAPATPTPNASEAPAAAAAGGAAASTNAPDVPAYTVDDVPSDKPFGDIDLRVTGSEQVQALLAALSEDDRIEVIARCQVVNDNLANYQADATEFCKVATGG